MDVRIAQIVEEKKPALGEKGQYGYVRQPEAKQKRSRKKIRKTDEEGVAGPSHQDSDGDNMPIPVPMPYQPPTSEPQDGQPAGYPALLYPPTFSNHVQASPPSPAPATRLPLDPAIARQNAPEQEMEDGDEDGEWAIRIGTAPPPQWAKRRREHEEEEPSKRMRGT